MNRSAEKSCCTPSRASDAGASMVQPGVVTACCRRPSRKGMVELAGGRFRMGYEGPEAWQADGEGPVREVEVGGFWIDATTVTNADFAEFVDATGYRSEAERLGWSYVFHLQLPESKLRKLKDRASVVGLEWWIGVPEAFWRKPEGPGSHIKSRMHHPVVHISWNDAVAYAEWAGKRLPTEAEWEYAARAGISGQSFPWGNELTPGGKFRCNTWQGRFPLENTGEDGHRWTAPAKSFQANPWGLYNVCGNVWEWCADWFDPSWHARASPETRVNPRGPAAGDRRVMKGGSFLCHASYCNRYRIEARSSNTPDSSTTNCGFRCVADL